MTKTIIHKTKKCGGEYEVLYTESSLPYLKCEKCNHEIKDWIKWDTDYKDYWKDELKWSEKKDHLMCLLGFFAEKYREHYKFEYSWSLNEKGLFRGAEVNVLRRVYNTFGTNPKIVKEYIEWYFQNKIVRRKKKILSLSFLAVPALMNEFKVFYSNSKTISRDKLLPEGMVRWIDKYTPTISEYEMSDFGDLRHLLETYKAGHIPSSGDIDKFINELKVKNIISEDYQIKKWRE